MKSNGAAITAIREGRGLTKTDLAALVDMDLSHLSRIESGQRNGTPAQIKALAAALVVPVTAVIQQGAVAVVEDGAA